MSAYEMISEFKILKVLFNPIKWVYELFADQTEIRIILRAPIGGQSEGKLIIEDGGDNSGRLFFGVVSECETTVIVTKITLDYDSSLQLSGLAEGEFIYSANPLNPDKPFRCEWNGEAPVNTSIMQAFGLMAKSQETRCNAIIITVYAHKERLSLFGEFSIRGRNQFSSNEVDVHFAKDSELFFTLPPGKSLATPLTSLAQSGCRVGGPGTVRIHEMLDNGETNSKTVHLE